MIADGLQRVLREFELGVPEGHTILLVDDEPENVALLEAALDLEYVVHTATSGAEALAVMEALGGVDLVISDQRMAGMTGVVLLTEVARRWPETVRMVLTAWSDVEPMVAAVNLGAVHRFLLKPWQLVEVRVAVADALHERSVRRAVSALLEDLVARQANLQSTLSELERTQEQVLGAERTEVLGRLASGITHEIRNQLSPLMLLVDTLATGDECPELTRISAAAAQTLDELANLVTMVNAFARNQPVGLQLRPTLPADLVAGALALVSAERRGEPPPVDVHLDDTVSAVEVDPSQVAQAAAALLRNALRAVPPGTRIHLSLASEGEGEFGLSVHDPGVGMDAATLAHAIEPFFSAFDPPGSGLGLSLARLIAESHGGGLTVESEPGRGTRATLHLPRRRVCP